MNKHLKYAWYLLRHKFWIIVYGGRLGVPCGRLIFHDLSKFLPDEWGPYVNHFYGSGDHRFELAWARHFLRNDHHWIHWQFAHPTTGDLTALPTPRFPRDRVPEEAAREMVADWMSVSKVKENDVLEWYEANKGRMNLHKETQALVETLLRMECR